MGAWAFADAPALTVGVKAHLGRMNRASIEVRCKRIQIQHGRLCVSAYALVMLCGYLKVAIMACPDMTRQGGFYGQPGILHLWEQKKKA